MAGHGILMRAEWDIERYLRNGRLIHVLPHCATPDANIYAVYPQRHQLAARVRAFVDFSALSFSQHVATKPPLAQEAVGPNPADRGKKG